MKKFRNSRAGLALAVALLLLTCLFTACSSKNADIDTEALCTELLGSGAFSEGLQPPASTSAALKQYGLEADSCESMTFYFSSGATAEELTILQGKSGGTMQVLQDAATYRLTYQKNSFENYIPAEIPKLDAAIVKTKGDYLIYCVAADSAAAGSIIDKYFD